MQLSRWRKIGIAAVALAAVAMVCDTADAGRRKRLRSRGSSSSHGSSGSSGGSYYASHGSSGSSGGSSSSSRRTVRRSSGSSSSGSSSSGSSSSHGSSGSSGSSSSHGSSGSSSGWYSSHGSSGSSGGSSSSSGGTVIVHRSNVIHPAHPQPGINKPSPAAGAAQMKEEAAPLPPPQAKLDPNKATLVVKVPSDATVFLVGTKMESSGTERRFRIPIPDVTKEYNYPIRVEVVRDGKTLVSEMTQKVKGGKEFALTVAESPDSKHALALVASR